MNSLEIIDKKEILKKRCHEIVDAAKAEIREMTEDEQKEFEANKEEIIQLNKQLKELEEKLANYEKEIPTDEEEPVDEENTENKENNKRSINTIMKKEFRLLSAIRDIANNKGLDTESSAVNEKGKEEMRKAGISASGQIQLPVSELRADITVANEHDDLVEVEMYDILEPLRAKNVLVNAGAKFLTGLVGDVQVPIMGAGNVNWEGEVDAAADANYTFTNVKLTPKRLSAFVEISKQFLVQDSLSAENLIRQDLINAINSKLESTILGTEQGTPTMPQGIFYEATGATPVSDFKGVCELEAEVEDANVMNECKYIMSNKAKAAFRNMAKSAKSNELVYQNGTIDGTEVLNTSNVAEKYVAYGDWSNLAIGQFGGIDLTVDPYTKAKEGKIVLVVNAFFDAKVLRPNAIKATKVA